MSRQIIVSDEVYAALCEIAARMRQATGSVAEFSEIIEALAGCRGAA
jgi:hypothetical protein